MHATQRDVKSTLCYRQSNLEIYTHMHFWFTYQFLYRVSLSSDAMIRTRKIAEIRYTNLNHLQVLEQRLIVSQRWRQVTHAPRRPQRLIICRCTSTACVFCAHANINPHYVPPSLSRQRNPNHGSYYTVSASLECICFELACRNFVYRGILFKISECARVTARSAVTRHANRACKPAQIHHVSGEWYALQTERVNRRKYITWVASGTPFSTSTCWGEPHRLPWSVKCPAQQEEGRAVAVCMPWLVMLMLVRMNMHVCVGVCIYIHTHSLYT